MPFYGYIQIQLPIVSREHAKLKVQGHDGAFNIIALSKTNNTKLNGVAIPNRSPLLLYESDIITIGDRHFMWGYPNGSRLSKVKRPEAETIGKSSPVKKDTVELEDSNVESITKRIVELEAAEERESRGKRVDPSNEVLPTTYIYAALIILFLGVILGKFFL